MRCLALVVPLLVLPVAFVALVDTSAAAAAPAPVAPAVPMPPMPPGATAAGNAFFVDLWQQLRARPGDVVFSPTSVWSALQLLQPGARGETAARLAEVTGVNDDATADGIGAVHRARNDPTRPYTLRAVDRVFVDDSFPASPDYLATLRTRWGADAETVAFGAPRTIGRINAWVAEQTAQRIPTILSPAMVDGDTALVLVDAVYFLGRWAQPFDPERTKPAPFHVSPERDVTVPTMQVVADFARGGSDDVDILELPYEGDDLAMWIVLPRTPHGLAAVEARLDVATLDAWGASLRPPDEVVVRLPKFEIDTGVLDLKPALTSLGLGVMFDRARADFHGITAAPTGALWVSFVAHRAFVRVDEVSTEAAAATAMGMQYESMTLNETLSRPFVADHPFLFLIRDRRSGLVLFAGRVTDPS